MKKILLILTLALALPACGQYDGPKYERIGGQGSIHLVVVKDRIMGRDPYRQIGRSVCVGANACVVMFWNDANKVNPYLPITDQEFDARVAQFNYNKTTGLDRVEVYPTGG